LNYFPYKAPPRKHHPRSPTPKQYLLTTSTRTGNSKKRNNSEWGIPKSRKIKKKK